MRTFLLLAVVLPFCAPARAAEPSTDEAPSAVDGRILAVEGEVTVFSPELGEEGAPAEEGMPLETGDRVVTGAASKAEFGVEGDSIVELGPSAEFVVEDARPESVVWRLTLGSLWAKVKSPFVARHGLRVRTPHAVASVRGTEFGVEVEAPESGEAARTFVGVFDEGRVAVAGADGGEETALEAGEELSVDRGARPGAKRRLERFLRHRDRMKRLRARHAKVRKLMKTMKPGDRRELRRKLLERMRKGAQRRGGRDEKGGRRGRPGRGRPGGRP